MLDPDIVLADDFPNPFERAPRGWMCMAPEWQYGTLAHRYPWMACLDSYAPHLEHSDPREHYQGGMCLYEPALHGPLIEKLHQWWVDRGCFSKWPLFEQPLWSDVGERHLGLPILRVSRLLNRHTPTAARPLVTWGAHYTGGKKHLIEQVDGRGEATGPAKLRRTASFMMPPIPKEAIREWAGTFAWQENCVFVGADMLPLVWLASQIVEGRILWLYDWDRAKMGGVYAALGPEMLARKVTIVGSPVERYHEHVRSVLGNRPFLAVGCEKSKLEPT